MNATSEPTGWDAFLGRQVVLDLASPYVFVGVLAGAQAGYFVLTDADAHDLRDTSTTREKYVMDCRQHGVRANRQRVLVDQRQVVSLSLLEDVVEF